jgi:hypothetical protein
MAAGQGRCDHGLASGRHGVMAGVFAAGGAGRSPRHWMSAIARGILRGGGTVDRLARTLLTAGIMMASTAPSHATYMLVKLMEQALGGAVGEWKPQRSTAGRSRDNV